MKTKFMRFLVFFCCSFLMFSCLLITPSPVWAYQPQMGEGGYSSGAEPSEPKAGGSFDEHVNSAVNNAMVGGAAGASGVLVTGGDAAAIAKGYITGAVANTVKGCLSGCHDPSTNTKSHGKHDKP